MTGLKLLRVRSTSDPQHGILYRDGELICLTLELPYLNNEKLLSSIPIGQYTCVRSQGRKTLGGSTLKTTYEVTGVPKRSGILFHPGNSRKDSSGCILVGMGIDGTKQEPTITRSLDGFQRFLTALRGVESFVLLIGEL